MKKVIFICLLSISMCLSVPAGEEIAKPSPAAAQPTQATPAAQAAPPAQAVPTKEPVKAANETAKTPETVPSATHNETAKAVTPAPAKDPKEASNKTVVTEKPAAAANDTKKAETVPTVAPTEGKPKNETAAGPEGKTNGTTVVVTPTTTVVPPLKSRAFDGPSFVGGIILTLGLLAIGFMGFKYYKNQTERNYHTL